MVERRLLPALVAVLCAACGGRDPIALPLAAASVPPVKVLPSASAASSAPPAAHPSSGPVQVAKEPVISVSLVLHPGEEPCTIVFDVEAEERPDSWVMRNVHALGTLKGPACEASPMFDPKLEEDGPDAFAALPFLLWIKPGHTPPADEDFRESPPGIVDLDFDGWLDVCAAIDPTSETPQRCWLFDPKKRIFVRSPAIDVIPNLGVDVGNHVLTGFAHSGNIYEGTEYSWIAGKLELTTRETQWLGQKPNGDALPGYSYVVTEKRRGGKLVKVHEGATKE